MNFTPILRFIACSDVHCKENDPTEPDRFKKGMSLAYSYAESSSYKNIDAVYVIGDFANQGTFEQMSIFKSALDDSLKPETKPVLTMASHEFMHDGEEGALKRFDEIFHQSPDTHFVINGFHFIAVTTERGCSIDDAKQQWLSSELKKAAEDDEKKPIFVFQHPHLSDTVYGSINWGDNDIYAVLMDYPQVVDFSGHSHAPINDPRSVHQKHFTSFGTGSFSYFELDEFDFTCGTVPPDSRSCAQLLVVEADRDGRVRVLPLDILSGNFFNEGVIIDEPWNPDSFKFTDERYRSPETPFFADNAKAHAETNGSTVSVIFDAASSATERIDAYKCTIKKQNGTIIRQHRMTSSYYIYNMPDEYKMDFENIPTGNYTAEITAEGFWGNKSKKLVCAFTVE